MSKTVSDRTRNSGQSGTAISVKLSVCVFTGSGVKLVSCHHFLAAQATRAKETILESDTVLWIPCGCLHTYEKKMHDISSDAPTLGAVPGVVPEASKEDKS